MHQSRRGILFVQQQCLEPGDTGVRGPGSTESDMGGKYLQGQYRVSLPNVSVPSRLSLPPRIS